MQFSWDYPLFVVPHANGYASLVHPRQREVQLLAVYTEQQAAAAFMSRFALPGSPRRLRNAREFCWLLERLHEPVSRVAFDPQPAEQEIGARWTATVGELLEHHLEIDFSPWPYPCYVVARQTGFSCIEGQTSDGRPLTAIALFTDLEKAQSYLSAAGEAGTLCRLADVDQARQFLSSLALRVFAVALDPVVQEGQRTAKYCFDIATLLEKYLVRKGPTAKD